MSGSSKSIKPNSVKKSRSSNLTKNAGFPIAPIKGNYKLRERAITKRRIYDLILAGKSYVSIMEELGISERTFYRYLDVIFAQERDFIKETIPQEEIGRQLIILRDRFLQQKQEIDEWLTKDPNAEDRTELVELRASLCNAVYKTYEEGPIMMSSRHEPPPPSHEEEEESDTKKDYLAITDNQDVRDSFEPGIAMWQWNREKWCPELRIFRKGTFFREQKILKELEQREEEEERRKEMR